ncbi:hypothetical protein [Saccharothrix deserti]|uniref:hypothetical protein n=1 Tax=Saccharothrix deserti TaxID=2593674 RepID=UPI00131B4298|nr:hypothetical protein [Saccharothrix deserti]
MATPEEIELRIQEADTARSARRAAAARQVGELVQRRADIVEQLQDIERQLGDVLANAQDVIDVDEMAEFTDVKATDLSQWLAGRKATRAKRKKPATGASGARSDASRGASAPGTPKPGSASAAVEPAVPPTDTTATPERVTAQVT